MSPERWRILSRVLVGLAILSLFLSFAAGMYSTPDAYVYYGLSKSLLVDQSYHSFNLLGSPPHIKYPAGYPALLALLQWSGKESMLFLNAVGAIALLLGAVLLAWRLRLLTWSPVAMTLAVVLLVSNRYLQHYAWSTNSDIPYLGVVGISLYLFLRHEERSVPGWIFLGVVLGLMATGVRLTGVTLLGSMGLWLLLRKRFVPAVSVGIGMALGAAPWGIWVLIQRSRTHDNYFRALSHEGASDFIEHLRHRAEYLLEGLGQLTAPHLDRLIPSPLVFLFLGLGVLGVAVWYLIARRPRGYLLLLIYLASNVILVLVTRFYTHQRYLYPTFFVLLIVFVQALVGERGLGRIGRVVCGGLVLFTLAVSSVAVARSVPDEVRLWSEPAFSARRVRESGAGSKEKDTILSLYDIRERLPADVSLVHCADGMRGTSYAAILLPVPIGWRRPADVASARRIIEPIPPGAATLVLFHRRKGPFGPWAELVAADDLIPAPNGPDGHYETFLFRAD